MGRGRRSVGRAEYTPHAAVDAYIYIALFFDITYTSSNLVTAPWGGENGRYVGYVGYIARSAKVFEV